MSESLDLNLTHASLGELQGGGIGYAIDQALGDAMRDCHARPALAKPRKVTITVTLTPTSTGMDMGTPVINGVGAKADVKIALPSRAGNEEFLGVSMGVGLDGTPEPKAVFTQVPLLRAGSN
ncbi:hypothetical protein [Deinococcus sp. QL22]|uniref:hypothetical protein n=1 Tax=Deinococcus sp. QL22 TaxID=2939437 RepID=UPI002018372F|nr:hypothetical protein [Deinococcus sp. QL22]UQN10417.1 hypothetical protein M1R55_28795 [Deinococcus sp. QL22]UQN10551.1 hypothetical protein M1R55_29470 [Deinococcus sp. QL22]